MPTSIVDQCKGMDMADSTDQLLQALTSSNGPRVEMQSPVNTRAPPLEVDLCELITLNVGGARFVTTKQTLERITNSRLSNLQKSDHNYNPVTQEWFFDRNPSLFNFVLDFYRSDELHLPHNFCGPSIKKELQFWRIEECDISPCCWNRYREFEEEKKIFEHIEQAFESPNMARITFTSADIVNPSQWLIWKRRIWLFLEEPMSSRPAQVWTVFFLVFVLSSIAVLCIETLPALRVPINHADGSTEINNGANTNRTFTNNEVTYHVTNSGSYINATMPSIPLTSLPEATEGHKNNLKIQRLMETQPHPVLENIDSFCTCFFTIEFFIRFLVAPDRVKFWKSLMNIIDVLCVLPMWIKYVMLLCDVRMSLRLLPVFFLIMMLRVLRICRVLRLARHYAGVKILLLALKASFQELAMLVIFVFIVVLIFAVVIYYAEFFVEDTFNTIPDGYWWAIITLTTVGYGDMYPKSGLGYVVGAMCALTGILATGLPVPIIANNFNLYYSHAALKEAVHDRQQSRRRRSSATSKTPSCSETPKAEPYVVKEATVFYHKGTSEYEIY